MIRRNMCCARGALLALALAMSGCSAITGCDERSIVYELVPSDPAYSIHKSFYDLAVEQGWDCNYDGDIRNAFGVSIGERQVCTICE